VFLVCWGVISPLIGIIVGHVLSRSWQLKQWQMERRWQDYQAVMTAITSAYMAILRLDNAHLHTRELADEVDAIKHDSFRVIRDRIAIADELERGSILADWDTAVTNYELRPKEDEEDAQKRFGRRFNAINEQLVRMARQPPPRRLSQVWRWLEWWMQYKWAKIRKRV
jgi:hypothetical protein